MVGKPVGSLTGAKVGGAVDGGLVGGKVGSSIGALVGVFELACVGGFVGGFIGCSVGVELERGPLGLSFGSPGLVISVVLSGTSPCCHTQRGSPSSSPFVYPSPSESILHSVEVHLFP